MPTFTPYFRFTLPDFDQTGWDTALNNDLTMIDSLLGQFNTGLTLAGLWTNGSLYVAGVAVIDGLTGHIWVCGVTHTSSVAPGTFATERSLFPSYWTDVTNGAVPAAASAAASAGSAASSATSATASATSASDASTSATSAASSATSAANAVSNFVSTWGFRNAVINGACEIWQRATSFNIAATLTYTADQVTYVTDGTFATTTITKLPVNDNNVINAGLNQYLRLNIAGSPTGATSTQLRWMMEGARTFAGKTVRITWWSRASSTFSITPIVVTFPGTGGSPAGGAITVGSTVIATTFYTKYTQTVTLPLASSLTMGTNNDSNIYLGFRLPTNTNLIFDITGVTLEIDTGAATIFEYRNAGIELGMCHRFFQGGNQVLQGYGLTGVAVGMEQRLVSMRATPTVTIVTNGNGNVGSYTLVAIGSDFVYGNGTVTATGAYAINVNFTASAVL